MAGKKCYSPSPIMKLFHLHNTNYLQKWSPSASVNLHGIQFRIAKRGLELLEVGGKMVYSTCSLNPVEDEAVLYRLLQETGDSVEILDSSHMVPGLKYSEGIRKWKLAGKEKNVLYDDFSEVPLNSQSFIRPYMFPPPEGVDNDKFHLNRCMRILPHQQDTGGFFVAVLHKKTLCPWESKKEWEESCVKNENNGTNGERKTEDPPAKKKPRYQGYKEDPFMYFEENEPAFNEVKDYFQLSDVSILSTIKEWRKIKHILNMLLVLYYLAKVYDYLCA